MRLSFSPELFSVDEVNTLVENAKTALLDGVIVTNFTVLGSSGQFNVTANPQDILDAAEEYFRLVNKVTGQRMRVGSRSGIATF